MKCYLDQKEVSLEDHEKIQSDLDLLAENAPEALEIVTDELELVHCMPREGESDEQGRIVLCSDHFTVVKNPKGQLAMVQIHTSKTIWVLHPDGTSTVVR